MAKITKVRTKERIKQTGEVFTPTPLVQEILDKLPPELFHDHTKTFLDPACGDGQFLTQVIEYKISNGSTPTEALHTTYGVELMQDNVDECKLRLLNIVGDTPLHQNIINHNIICANSLEYDYDALQPYTLENSTMSDSEKLKRALEEIVIISSELLKQDAEIKTLHVTISEMQKIIDFNPGTTELDLLVGKLSELVTQYKT